MRRSLLILSVLGACHAVSEREHGMLGGDQDAGAAGAAPFTPEGDGGEGGNSAAGGTQAGAGETTSGSSGTGSSGTSGHAAVGGAGGTSVGAPGGSSALGGAGGEAGQVGAPECQAGVECATSNPCEVGKVSCVDGVASCSAVGLEPEGHECGAGNQCTADGACLKVVTSCKPPAVAGCGTLSIKGGSYQMGDAKNTSATTQPVTVGDFVIDTHEVTVARFRRFWSAGHPKTYSVLYPDGVPVVSEVEPWEPDPTAVNTSYNWSPQPADRESHPVNRVTWATAFAFCAWDGGRLPTEAEWEYAAVGREVPGRMAGRLYPWGQAEPTCEQAWNLECSTTTVGAEELPPVDGLFHVIGNVTEWTADVFQTFGGTCWSGAPRVNPVCREQGNNKHVVRGTSFLSGAHPASWRVPSDDGGAPRGIRCVRDLVR